MRKNLWKKWIAAALSLGICLSLAPLRAQAGQGGGSSGASIPGTVIPTTFDDTWNLNNTRFSDISIKKSGVYHITDSEPS